MVKKTVIVGLEIDTVISCLINVLRALLPLLILKLSQLLIFKLSTQLMMSLTISLIILSINDVINIYHSLIIINFDDNSSFTCIVLTILYILL